LPEGEKLLLITTFTAAQKKKRKGRREAREMLALATNNAFADLPEGRE